MAWRNNSAFRARRQRNLSSAILRNIPACAPPLRVQDQARETGRVVTLCGRARDLSEGLKSEVRSIREFSERAAFNTLLQGSAADLMKAAMIALMRRLDAHGARSRLLLQVHDELVLNVVAEESTLLDTLIRDAMTLEQPLRVPLAVDIQSGPSWLES